MKKDFLRTVAFATIAFSLYACNGGDAKKSSDENKNESGTIKTSDSKFSGKSLIDGAVAPEGYTFGQQDFEGAGTMQITAGAAWQKDGNTLYNEKLDMTIISNTQNEDMRDRQEEYVQSYIDNNFRDATNFKLISRESGTVNDTKASRVIGSFNNGMEYATRDYLFFTGSKSSILQARTVKENEALFMQMIDYMAQSFHKK